jgi:hypothetical protein
LLEDTAGENSPPEEDGLDADFFFRNPMVNNVFFTIYIVGRINEP